MARRVHVNRSGSIFIGGHSGYGSAPLPAPARTAQPRASPSVNARMQASADAVVAAEARDAAGVPPAPPGIVSRGNEAEAKRVAAHEEEYYADDTDDESPDDDGGGDAAPPPPPSWDDTLVEAKHVLAHLDEAMPEHLAPGATMEAGFAAVGRHLEVRLGGKWRRAAVTRYLPGNMHHRVVFMEDKSVYDMRLSERNWRWVSADPHAKSHAPPAPEPVEKAFSIDALLSGGPSNSASNFRDFTGFLARQREREREEVGGGNTVGTGAAEQETATDDVKVEQPPAAGCNLPFPSLSTVHFLADWALRNVVHAHGLGLASSAAAVQLASVERECVLHEMGRRIEAERAAGGTSAAVDGANSANSAGAPPSAEEEDVDAIEAILRQVVAHSLVVMKMRHAAKTAARAATAAAYTREDALALERAQREVQRMRAERDAAREDARRLQKQLDEDARGAQHLRDMSALEARLKASIRGEPRPPPSPRRSPLPRAPQPAPEPKPEPRRSSHNRVNMGGHRSGSLGYPGRAPSVSARGAQQEQAPAPVPAATERVGGTTDAERNANRCVCEPRLPLHMLCESCSQV